VRGEFNRGLHGRHKYELVVSQYVIVECGLGDYEAAQKQLTLLAGIPVPENPQGLLKLRIFIKIC
jgi:hypothetical protein